MFTVTKRKLKGSVLGFSVLLLSLFLFSGITVLSVAVLERKASFTTQKSIIAFQGADSAAERVLNRIYLHNSPTLLVTPLDGVMTDVDLNALTGNLSDVVSASTDCVDANSEINGANVATSGPAYTFQVIFFDESNGRIGCSDQQWRDKVIKIRAEGMYQRTSRVIEIGIRPRPPV